MEFHSENLDFRLIVRYASHFPFFSILRFMLYFWERKKKNSVAHLNSTAKL